MLRLDAPLLNARGVLCGIAGALITGWLEASSIAFHGHAGLFNDFYLYWGGVKLLAMGRDPYDPDALRLLLQHLGLHPATGMGYTYPLLLACLMLPLTLLGPSAAAPVFSVIGLVALAVAIALLLTPLSRLCWWELAILTVGCASFASVLGSAYFGQANLLVLPLLALAYRGAARGSCLALASAVKLYPLAGLAAFLPRWRHDRRGLALATAGFATLAVLPNLVAGARGPHLLEMLTPDAYWTDESLNGFISRLAGSPLHTAPPLLPGLPVEPAMLAITALLSAGVLTLVLWVGGEPWDGCLALLLAWATVAAPRNSMWNFARMLIAMAWCWPRVRRRLALLAVLVAGWALIELQMLVQIGGPGLQHTPLLGLLGSLAIYGGLLVTGLVGRLLVTPD